MHVGLILLGGTCLVAAGVAFCVVRSFLRRTQLTDRPRTTVIALASTSLSLVAFAAAFVVLLVLLASTSDRAGDAAIYQLEGTVRWLRTTLRP